MTTDNYLKNMAKEVKELEAAVKKLPALEGFTGTWVDDRFFRPGGETKNYVLTSADGTIKFTFLTGGVGRTDFETSAGWRTFDRTGVESSFYWKPWDYKGAEKVDMKKVFADQLRRIAERRDYAKTAVKVPEIGYTVAPGSIPELKARLRKSGSISFTPSGFGTGYCVTRRRPSPSAMRYGAKRAGKELEKFFGHSPLFIETMDCD